MLKKLDFRLLYSFSFAVLFLMILSVNLAQAGKGPDAVFGGGEAVLKLATGSPGSLGLLEPLALSFCQDHSCRVEWYKQGSGASLRALKNCEVDMVLVHAPAAEKKAVKEGWATRRTLIGSNEFYIVGPPDDPAGISKATTVQGAYKKIAAAQAKFFSRGDDSGTHKKEMMIWAKAGIEPAGQWYVVTGDFMGPTLLRADRELGYFMTGSSTFAAKSKKLKNLKVLFKGDPLLANVYHGLVATKENCPNANIELAVKFLDFIASEEGQKIIGNYGKNKFGVPLYNDAKSAVKHHN